MTTGVTNLDILELSVPSIEADEINSGNAAAGDLLTADGNGGASWQTPSADGPGYAEYVAVLTQLGETAPVATVIHNTLGFAVTWTRVGAGVYTANGAFPDDRTFVMPSHATAINGDDALITIQAYTQPAGNVLYIQGMDPSTLEAADLHIGRFALAVRIYAA